MLINIIKSLMPKSLLFRILLIITLPAILSQIISVMLFYESHWKTVEEKMLTTLADEVKLISALYSNLDEQTLKKISAPASIIVEFHNKKVNLINNIKSSEISDTLLEFEQILRNTLKSKFQISYSEKKRQVVIALSYPKGDLVLKVSRKRFYTPTTSIFIYWTIGSATLMLLITILFAKNQIRSITNLSIAAEKLGKGESNAKFKPQGAVEVKKAGQAFLDMQIRIENQIQQRTKLLAGVSHDLRTPITRIKLHLALLNIPASTKEIYQDIEQMEQTINDYLDFAQQEDIYNTQLMDLGKLIKKLLLPYKYKFKKIQTNFKSKVFANIRQNQFSRAITNFLDNAHKYSQNIKVVLYQTQKNTIIEIHDDGPGISQNERENVLQPFYRIENSRNKNSGGIGLGMSIAHDIIVRHGGKLKLSNSYLGGLLVIIELPL